MTALILGKNGSGKSACAEELACAISSGKLYYIATLLPYGADDADRIEKHRAQRAGKGFITAESPYAEVETAPRDTALLEDVSNLAANLMFEKRVKDVKRETLRRIRRLSESCMNLVMVGITGFEAGDGGNRETREYIALLNDLNAALYDMSDVVIEMAPGRPILRKGELPCRF